MTDITLTDNERAALEALWRAGGEMDIPRANAEHVLRLGYYELAKINTYTWLVYITDKGRALAVDLFTPPLVMPTTEGDVFAWLSARGLWADTDKLYVSSFPSNGRNDIFVILRPGLVVSPGKQNKYVAAIHVGDVDEDAANEFRADFDRACAIARALNANKGEVE